MAKKKNLTACFGIWMIVLVGASCTMDRTTIDLKPARSKKAIGHHLIWSAQLEPGHKRDDHVNLMPWREHDDVIEGWDWSLPRNIQPVPASGLIFSSSEKRHFPGNKLADVAVFWRDVEPEEGRFDFESLRQKLENVPEGITGYRLYFYATVAYRLRNNKREQIAPVWLEKYGIPVIDMTSMEGRFRLYNYAIWDKRYHERYLRVVKAMGSSGIPHLKGVRIVYVGAISKSWGDEMFVPRDVGVWCEQYAGLSPDVLEQCLKERLDAWAKAFKNVEYKLAWVGDGTDGVDGNLDYRGIGARMIERAYDLGMGQRSGFVENYLYHLNNPWLGQRIDDRGYLIVDDTCVPISENRVFGDENEEYGDNWTGRFGPLETHPYRYHESMVRVLQMRRNYLWMSYSSVNMDPALTAYVSLALGRRVDNSPDAFCYLRQSTVRASDVGKKGEKTVIRNFERWLLQRDREGYRTQPAIRANQHAMMWMVPPGSKYDWIARRTDLASGNRRIGLILNDRFLIDGPHSVAIKVTYHDIGHGRWALVYAQPDESHAKRSISCRNTGKVFTATFHIANAFFPAKNDAFDFYIEAEDEDVTVSFVRVIKARHPN